MFVFIIKNEKIVHLKKDWRLMMVHQQNLVIFNVKTMVCRHDVLIVSMGMKDSTRLNESVQVFAHILA